MDKINNFYKNKKILITGATGFKGSWLCSWLLELGAKVYGTGFTPNQNKNLFYDLELNRRMILKIIDIRDYNKLKKFINTIKPDIIFHLAAQPLVGVSYLKPVDTFSINFNGTLNILEIAKSCKFIKSIIAVTSDKCYEDLNKTSGYKEGDKLGGTDPYSASKAASELVINSYYKSFFKKKNNCGVSSVRAGNVIGGGDWSTYRLIPDCIKNLLKNKIIVLRNPNYNRPWQHVLEPLKGYLILAKKQFENPKKYSGAWNFGSSSKSIVSVKRIAELIIKFWGKGSIKTSNNKFHETKVLQINSTKAKNELAWNPSYNIVQAVNVTSEWYLKVEKEKADPIKITKHQINNYMLLNKKN
ncbi:CDP-glucose 4,6-dehydratase [Pelagibacteraceae bacterium]|nr:CDP-glucose 4,6-dehydratase [Pelagibacteraceae bacterium]